MAAGKKYLRCGCPACGNVLTYPDYSAGGTSVCDKCGKSVRLPAAPKAAPPAPPAAPRSTSPPPQPPRPTRSSTAPPPRRGFLRFVLWAMNLGVVAAVVIFALNREQPTTSEPSEQPAPITNQISPPPVVAQATTNETSPATNLPSALPPQTNIVTITNVVTVTNEPIAARPVPPTTNSSPGTNTPGAITNAPSAGAGTNSLAVLGLAIERPRGNKGSRLTYVTGVLQNQSDRKRFGVRIDLNLLDRARNNVGMATDYTPVIEPKGTWRFRALVLDARAVGASVAAIREDQ